MDSHPSVEMMIYPVTLVSNDLLKDIVNGILSYLMLIFPFFGFSKRGVRI